MSGPLLNAALVIGQLFLSIAMICASVRLMRGPRAHDRVLALDTLYVDAMLLMLVFGMQTRTTYYFEAALAIGMLGFVATVALAKFLLRGEVIE